MFFVYIPKANMINAMNCLLLEFSQVFYAFFSRSCPTLLKIIEYTFRW